MSVASVSFLFLTHLGLGIGLSLLFVKRQPGVKFFRFNGGMAAGFLFLGLTIMPDEAAAGPAAATAYYALVVATVALGFYWLTVGRVLRTLRVLALRVAAVAGLVALVAHALWLSAAAPAWQILTILSVLSSTALLGGSCTAMVLGHYYLVVRSLDVSHLQSMVKLHLGSTVIRVLIVGSVVWLAVVTTQPAMGVAFGRYITSVAGIFFWQRVLFGLVGPLVLACLAWETAKIHSTQSATGILYIDFFSVMVGEVLAKYLLLATSVPL